MEILWIATLPTLSLGYSGPYPDSQDVAGDGSYLFSWDINSTHIRCKIEAKSNGGWVALGFAEPTAGGMRGSDIVQASVDDSSGEVTLQDGYYTGESDDTSKEGVATAGGVPQRDSVSQDWVATSGAYDSGTGVTTVELSRAFWPNLRMCLRGATR